LVEDHRHVGNAVPPEGLRHNRALVCGLNSVEYLEWAKAELGESFGPKLDGHTRYAGWRFHLHIGGAGNFREHPHHFPRLRVEDFEIIPEKIDHHGSRFSGNRFADAIAQESEHLVLDAGELAKDPANLAGHGFLRLPGERFQIHVKFAAVWS